MTTNSATTTRKAGVVSDAQTTIAAAFRERALVAFARVPAQRVDSLLRTLVEDMINALGQRLTDGEARRLRRFADGTIPMFFDVGSAPLGKVKSGLNELRVGRREKGAGLLFAGLQELERAK